MRMQKTDSGNRVYSDKYVSNLTKTKETSKSYTTKI